jgi:hypothetical protein
MKRKQRTRERTWKKFSETAVLVALCAAVAAVAVSLSLLLKEGQDATAAASLLNIAPASSAASGLGSIRLSNDYGEPPKGYPWPYIAEPYRSSTFELELRGMALERAGARGLLDFRWTVDGHLQGAGPKVQVHFTELGEYAVKVAAYLVGSGEVLGEEEITVRVKYVRREIRKLLDSDREAFFNAIAVLQRVPTKVGQRLYGSKYLSKDYLVRLHLYYGGMAGCDHWHQGPGFVTSHMAYTMLFEQSLQSVNPAVTVPFWDFTLESTFYEPHTWRRSSIFARDWFGDASPANELHTVTAGRFAYAPTMANAREFSAVYNSYGLLRAPWNNDPSPFVTRSSQVYGLPNNMKPSGCNEYARVLKFTNWIDFSRQLNSAAHGHIHETVGGSWDHSFGRSVGPATPAVFTFAHMIQALSKDVWRSGFLECPESCELNVPWEKCRCTCPTEKRQGMSDYDMLRASGVLASTSYFDADKHLIESFVDPTDGQVHYSLQNTTTKTAGEEAAIYSDLLRYVCDPGHIGTMFQASSSNDVIFWVLHPTIDRLWHWKRLGDPQFVEDWPHNEGSCYGHNPEDLQPLKKGLFGEKEAERSGTANYYRNSELYEQLHPENEKLPYVYADFSWPHCEQLGYRMTPS